MPGKNGESDIAPTFDHPYSYQFSSKPFIIWIALGYNKTQGGNYESSIQNHTDYPRRQSLFCLLLLALAPKLRLPVWQNPLSASSPGDKGVASH